MKPGHAVALALVGWYLMMPPWFTDKKPHTEAPMRQWNQMGAFDTKDDCTRERHRRIGLVGTTFGAEIVANGNPDVPKPDATALAFASSIFAAQCVASDDPRLKSN